MWITHGNGERISGITSSCVIFHFLTAQCINLLPGTDLKTLTDKTKIVCMNKEGNKYFLNLFHLGELTLDIKNTNSHMQYGCSDET